MSIFFDFDVGPSGRRFRRAVDGDKWDIKFLVDHTSETLFGAPDIGSLIELSVLSICMINEEKEVVGFIVLNDHPNIASVDPADWETWIRNMYQRYYVSRHTLFIHFMCCSNEVVGYFLDEALITVFNNDLYVNQILLVMPPHCSDDILAQHQVMQKRNVTRYHTKQEDDPNNRHLLYVFNRNEFCPKLRMRRAVEEDNDDIVEILESKCPRLVDMYGKYYISELIGRYPESTRKIIVAEFQDKAVGVMCLNTEIYFNKLAASHDLTPYFGLMKPTSAEKDKAKRSNVLLHTFGEPIMLGKWSPYQIMNTLENTSLIEGDSSKEKMDPQKPRVHSKVYFGRKSIRKSFDHILYRHHQSDDLSEKVYLDSEIQSRNTSNIVTDLLEADPFDYEIVNIDTNLLAIPDVNSFSSLSKQIRWKESSLCMSSRQMKRGNRPVKQPKIQERVIEYKGAPNAFMIELYGFHDEIHLRHSFDLLEAAFELMKAYDYCIIKVPCADKTFPLLRHFTFVPAKPNVCDKYALYISHRASFLGKLRVREAEIFDIPQIANLLQDVDGKETLWTLENTLHNKDNMLKAYVFISGLSIVGIGILEPAEQIDFVVSRFNIDLYHVHKYHYSGSSGSAGFMTLKVAQVYPVFEVHFRFFIREMMRLSNTYSILWLTAYRNKMVANKANSLASAMIPLIPRRTEINCMYVPELKHLAYLSRKITPFAAWYLGKRLTSIPRVDITTRIIVVGASRTAMAFLDTLLFSDSSSYLFFTNVTLVSPNGLPYIRHTKPVVEMMFLKSRSSTDAFMKSVPYTYYINVVHGTLNAIDKQNKCITLCNGGVYHYDLLFLLLGKQYQPPNYLTDMYEKERLMKSPDAPSYGRRDEPRLVDPEPRIATDSLPENVFIINNKTQANNALNFVKNLIMQNYNHKILVYGASILAYCCLAALIELKVSPEDIIFVESFPSENANKIRVPVFCNANVDQTMREMLESLKITTYRSYYFQSWVVDDYNFVTHVNFLSYFQLVRLECSAFFYYGTRGINIEAFNALSKSGIVYDGGILIDHEFRTKDPFVYAAGPGTRYCRRYFADTFRQKYYDSYEVGAKLGVQIRNQLDPLFTPKENDQKKTKNSVRFSVGTENARTTSPRSNPSDTNSGKSTSSKITLADLDEKFESLPLFKKPITIHCILPGDLQYLEVRPPGLKTPNYYVQTLDYNGFVMETFKEGYFKLHLTKDYIVDGITCLSPGKLPVENFKNLYGISAIVLNNVHLRYTTMKLDNFFEFFRSPWAFFLYQDQCDELLAMVKELRPKGQRKGDTLGESLKVVGDKISNPSFRFDTRMKIRSKFEHSPHVEAITDYVLDWLTEKEILLPMYLQSSQLVQFQHDIGRHPAFKKHKTQIVKMFRSIF